MEIMIWFNIKELERRIVENEFSDKEGFNYFLAFSVLGVLATYVSTSENFITFIELLIGVAITIWGSYSIFKANSSGDGQDFFKRYFALSWVIGFRLLVFTVIIAIPLFIIYGVVSYDFVDTNSGESTSLREDFVTMIISSLILLVYYFLLTNSFKRVSMKNK
jgi:hypothetical protein